MNAGASGSAPRHAASRSESALAKPACSGGAGEGTVLAFDFGAKRIGVAVGETALGLAHPLDTITFEDNRQRFDAITRLVGEWHPTRFIVGCRGSEDTNEHPSNAMMQRFSRRLRARFDLPVDLVEEHLSSWDASRRMSEAGIPARQQKGRLDAWAACVILETWFQGRRRSADACAEGY